MNINTPSLFIDSTLTNNSTQPEIECIKGSRIITYDYTLLNRITKCLYCGHEGIHIHKRKETILKHASLFIDHIQLRVHYHQYRCPTCHGITLDSIPFRCVC